MIKEAIDRVSDLSAKALRLPLLVDHAGHRTFLYDDKEQGYDLLPRIVVQEGKVSNISSFIALVLEEARRRQNQTGEFMTVVFGQQGAKFSCDDRDRLDVYQYARRLSPQWETLRRGMTMQPHADFVRLLQALRPSIEGYSSVIRAFRKIEISSATKVVSSPVLVDGAAGVSLSVDVAVKNGAQETVGNTTFPAELKLVMPYVWGGDTSYSFSVEVAAELKRDKDNPEKATFLTGLVFPDMANVVEKAIADEVARFRGETASLSRLLVLEDY